jgi:hypothetical protein
MDARVRRYSYRRWFGVPVRPENRAAHNRDRTDSFRLAQVEIEDVFPSLTVPVRWPPYSCLGTAPVLALGMLGPTTDGVAAGRRNSNLQPSVQLPNTLLPRALQKSVLLPRHSVLWPATEERLHLDRTAGLRIEENQLVVEKSFCISVLETIRSAIIAIYDAIPGAKWNTMDG